MFRFFRLEEEVASEIRVGVTFSVLIHRFDRDLLRCIFLFLHMNSEIAGMEVKGSQVKREIVELGGKREDRAKGTEVER